MCINWQTVTGWFIPIFVIAKSIEVEWNMAFTKMTKVLMSSFYRCIIRTRLQFGEYLSSFWRRGGGDFLVKLFGCESFFLGSSVKRWRIKHLVWVLVSVAIKTINWGMSLFAMRLDKTEINLLCWGKGETFTFCMLRGNDRIWWFMKMMVERFHGFSTIKMVWVRDRDMFTKMIQAFFC